MRGTRWLLLLSIVLIAGGVGVTYYHQRLAQQRAAPPPPKALPGNVAAESKGWEWTHYDGKRPVAQVQAGKMRQLAAPSKVELEDVDLRIFDQAGLKYDRVKSAYASFDTQTGDLYSDGDVEIVLGVPAGGTPPEHPVTIRSSGVRFDIKTGKATTDRPASFIFGPGEGHSVGASYEPEWNDLRMLHDVRLDWRGGGEPMTIEAGQLIYKEDQSKVYLSPWSRLRKGSLVLEAEDSTIEIVDGAIRVVDAQKAKGSSVHAGRRLEYSAAALTMHFTEDGAIEKIFGRDGASLVALTEESRTTVTSDAITLDFVTNDSESALTTALAMGNGVLESKPLPGNGRSRPPTRILRSETIKTSMRPGGQEVDRVETEAPGTLEFFPNAPDQRRRRLDAERMSIQYGDNNEIRSFRGIQVATRTEYPAPAPPARTWSTDLLATFAPGTGEVTQLEQWGAFRYEHDARKAQADHAYLDAPRNTMTLVGKAKVWDQAGAVAADHILLNQADGGFTAEGKVSSTRIPDSKASGGGLLSQSEPLHATAGKMVTAAGSTHIVYEGGAVLWQGSSRLEAQRVEIDREAKTLAATGNVMTRLVELSQAGSPVYTVVHAPELIYRDAENLAHYRGGVRLQRLDVDVKARELKAFFTKPAEGATQLDRTVADGEVEIVSQRDGRTRTGTAEHAEYFLSEEKVSLDSGRPKLVDSVRGTTEGERLTYFAHDDRLLVEGAEADPAQSRLLRRNR